MAAGETWDGGVYSLLLMATFLSWVVFLICVALGFAFFQAGDTFRGWAGPS